jgi:hypothetical protein
MYSTQEISWSASSKTVFSEKGKVYLQLLADNAAAVTGSHKNSLWTWDDRQYFAAQMNIVISYQRLIVTIQMPVP